MTKTRFAVRFNRKNQVNKQGFAPIQIECLLNRKRKFYDTQIKAKPQFWDTSQNRFKSSHPNYILLNQRLNQILTDFEEFELSFLNAKKPFFLHMFDNVFTKIEYLNFNDFYKKELKNANICSATKKNHQSTLNRLNEFRKDIAFESLNFEFLHDFENFLRSEKCDIKYKNLPTKKLSQNTIHKYFKNIKTYVNLAINKDLININAYPFRKFKVKIIESEKQFLTPIEIEKIENCVLTNDLQKYQLAKDLFLFSVYTGLRYSDVLSLEKINIVYTNGETWIIKNAIKNINSTEIPVKIPIETMFNGKALKIINKYSKLGFSNIFPVATNQYLNRCLKKIAEESKVFKPITFHSARHTTATFLLYKGANLTTVQKILGHKKISTTQIYGHIMDNTLLNDLKAINF
jgi:integrase